MKTMRKVLTMTLVLMLVLSMTATAFATTPTGGFIEITGTATTEYTVVKMFDIEITPSGGYKYKVTADWEDFEAPGYFDVKDGYVIWNKSSVSKIDGAAIAQLAKAYAAEKGLTSSITASVGNKAEVFENGYYLLIPDDDTACGVTPVVNGETHTVTAKVEEPEFPSVVKKVQEDSTQTYGDANDVDIGQTVHFHTTITAGSNASNYVLHDHMDEHFDFDPASISITRGGNTVAASDYTVVTDGLTDGCSFHIEFGETFCNGLLKGATLVVTYTAVLKKGSAVDTEHPNETWLTHANGIPTEKDSTTTKTYEVQVTKKDQSDNLLPGAVFVLKDNIGKYYKVDETTGVVSWVADVEDATQYETTEENNCTVTFYGVDAEVFTLVEHVVPGGYTGTTDQIVNTKDVVDGKNSKYLDVVNTLGTALPETGGMGTTLFYAVGGLLVAAAVVLLVTKKRTGAAQ